MRLFAGMLAKLAGVSGFDSSVRPLPIDAQIVLSDERVFLNGLVQNERAENSPTVIRGTVRIAVNVPAIVIDNISVRLSGEFNKSEILALKGTRKKPVEGSVCFYNDSKCLFINKDITFYFMKRLFYEFPFEFVLKADLPECISTIYGSVMYRIQLLVSIHENAHQFYTPALTGVEYDCKEVTILRTVSQISSLTSESIIVQGVWREMIDYNFIVLNKIVKIGTDLNCTISLKPLQKGACRVLHVKVMILQEISLNGDRSQKFCDAKGLRKFNHTQKILLKEQRCQSEDYDEDGCLSFEWSLPLSEICHSYGNPTKLHPHTFHLNLPESIPNLKIVHQIKISLLIEDMSTNIVRPEPEPPLATQAPNFAIFSQLPSVLFGQAPSPTSNTTGVYRGESKKKIELSLTAPIFLVHKDAGQEIPPRYEHSDDQLSLHLNSALIYQNSPALECVNAKCQSEATLLDEDQSGGDPTQSFSKAVVSHKIEPQGSYSSRNSWFNLVARWHAEALPEYDGRMRGRSCL